MSIIASDILAAGLISGIGRLHEYIRRTGCAAFLLDGTQILDAAGSQNHATHTHTHDTREMVSSVHSRRAEASDCSVRVHVALGRQQSRDRRTDAARCSDDHAYSLVGWNLLRRRGGGGIIGRRGRWRCRGVGRVIEGGTRWERLHVVGDG